MIADGEKVKAMKTAIDEITTPLPFRQNWQHYYDEHGSSPASYKRFRAIIYHYYFTNRRSFSWREKISPYRVFISEVMLQQTQTSRVIPKFELFLETFPNFSSLANARFSDVLRVWKGLGYNRRARFLLEAAEIIHDQYNGKLPRTPQQLVALPGIGPATAASIAVFAYDTPHVFIETNIRTVFLHFFFQNADIVDDKQIREHVEATLDKDRPREWYYGLMDYGAMLKRTLGNLNRKSRHYSQQSRFEGSDRQMRGKILQLLLDNMSLSMEEIQTILEEPPERLERIVSSLSKDNIVIFEAGTLKLS